MKSSGSKKLFLVALIVGALIFAAPAMAAQVNVSNSESVLHPAPERGWKV